MKLEWESKNERKMRFKLSGVYRKLCHFLKNTQIKLLFDLLSSSTSPFFSQLQRETHQDSIFITFLWGLKGFEFWCELFFSNFVSSYCFMHVLQII